MADCCDHPNIKVLSLSEVVGVEGSAGNFRLKVLRRARHVDSSKCTGCGKCAEACRLKGKIPNEFDFGLRKRGAIYLPFLQAVPRIMTVDEKRCIFLTKGKCGDKPLCREACERGAIDFDQRDEVVELEAGAIIVATGFELFDPSGMFEYGYGRYANVRTAMEYERLINASGPTGGHLEVEPTKEHPRAMAFIQCVGARDLRRSPFCCSVCCMYAAKEAVLVKEHYPDTECHIFNVDMRAVGKGFDEFVERARKEYGVRFIRARPGQVTEDPQTKKLTVWYEGSAHGGATSLEVDMVILATALIPNAGAPELAKVLGVELDEHRFFKVRDQLTTPVDSTRDGIFIAGYCETPKDIPESVAQASGAAARAYEIIIRGAGGA
jgi:heterodisulfide reductase subunit A